MKRKTRYLSDRISYDIETTSLTDEGEKKAYVYSYAVCVNGEVSVFRHRNDFLSFVSSLAEEKGCDIDRRMVVYVHNLGYEWQFMKAYFDWEDVFANGSERNVIRALTVTGIEFRCSLALTSMRLGNVGKQVGVPKLEGDLDYQLIRHSETPLTEEEMAYVHNDVLIIDALLAQRLERDDYSSIPMTATGYVRREVLRAYRKDRDYQRLIASLTMTEEVYGISRAAYQGGYVHANGLIAGEVLSDVVAYDLSSSYPASLTQFTYPVSVFSPLFKLDDLNAIDSILEGCSAILDVEFFDVDCRYNFPATSESRCLSLVDAVVDNGRVFSATSMRTIVTDVDFKVMRRNYDTSRIVVHAMWCADAAYLPTTLVSTIVEMFATKTRLKGVAGMEYEYNAAKANVNSVYGMMGTDPVRSNFIFDGQLLHELPPDLGEALEAHNKSRRRTLYYPWGAWTTAHSRAVLLNTIMDLEDRGVVVAYCDTDSIYAVNHPAVSEVIEEVNSLIRARMAVAEKRHGIPGATAPEDPSGTAHQLGLFECETPEPLAEFKTLGAKRYAKRSAAGKFSVTVAGLSKGAAAYIEERGGMEFFADGMVVPAEHSGRLTHTYDEGTCRNRLVDYLGNVMDVEQTGFIHLEPSEYHLTVSDNYNDFLDSIRQ